MGHDDRERMFEKALQRHLRQGAARDAGAAANSQAEPASAACPDPAMLAAFHERMLSNEEMDAAKAHIAACSRCQEILAHLEATDEVLAELDQEKVLQLREPLLAGSPSQEEEVLQHAAAPSAAARPAAALKAPQSISTGRRAKVWRWVAPAAAIAAGLLLWVTTRDTLLHFKKPATGIQVAQEKSERQLADQVAPLPPASLPAESRENGRFDEALKTLNESKGSAGALSARRAPASPLGGVVGGVGSGVGGRSEETIRELPLQGRNSALNKAAPAKPAANAASQGDVSVTAAAPPSLNTNAAELDRATAKDRKKADSPATPASAPAGTAGGNIAGAAGEQNARDSGRKILRKENLEPGVSAELSASSAPSPQPATPPDAVARTAAKQGADAAEKKEAGANAMAAATAQAEVTANYEHSSDAQNSRAGLAKTSEARTNNAKTKDARTKDARMKDAPLILTPGGTVLWRLRAGGKIERSTDRGITWAQQNSGVNLELLAGSAPSDAVCWMVGRAGTILRTTDGGGHWSKVVSPINDDLGGIRAEDAQHATIFGAGNRTRSETSDGGVNWAPVKE